MINFKETEALVAAGPVFATSNLSYTDLAQHLLAIDAKRRELEEELKAGASDLYSRRVTKIQAGEELPGSDGLGILPGWRDQVRREQLAYQNREADEANRRAGLIR